MSEAPIKRRIVCAANKTPDGLLVLGVRHFDMLMNRVYDAIADGERYPNRSYDQGFVCNKGEFWNRQAAYVIAEAAGQIIRKTGNPYSRELFSEDLY